MALSNGTISCMSKKKSAAQPQMSRSGRNKQPVLGIRPPAELVELMRQLAEKHRRPLTTEVTIAFEEYLAKHGLWPASEEPSP